MVSCTARQARRISVRIRRIAQKKIGNNSAGEGVSCSTAGRKKTVISFVASPQRACELLLFFILFYFIQTHGFSICMTFFLCWNG